MPRQTDGDKIDNLEKVYATLIERVDNVRDDLKRVDLAGGDMAKELRELKTEFALLKKEVDGLRVWKDEQKKEKDEHTRRLWAFGPNVVGAIVNVLLSAAVSGLVAYYALRQ